MTVEYRAGDLFAQGLPALAHGVYCKGVMGKGVAGQSEVRVVVVSLPGAAT